MPGVFPGVADLVGRYYSRQGRELSLMEWALSYENMTEEARRVARTALDGEVVVSTVWLGLDHQWAPAGPPLIFETMIFGGPLDGETWRYATEEQALAGHAYAVVCATAGVMG